MKHLLQLTLIAAITLTMGSCKNRHTEEPSAEETDSTEVTNLIENENMEQTKATDIWANLPEEPIFNLKTSEGTMKIALYKDTPLHRENFIKLAKEHFYDGILFHRVINGFMIQVGDPYTKDSTMINQWGTGGPGYTIPAEILSNHTHKKGALSAARLGDRVNPAKESSGSQFFIVQDEVGCTHLDGEYTVFGEVVAGLETIDRIASTRVDGRDRPLKPISIISIIPDNDTTISK